MPYDLLAILCEKATDAGFAAARIPRRANMRRFFLFLGDRPEDRDIAWMGGNDMHIHLDRVNELPECERIAVRAAITFTDSSAWNLLFCWADAPPEDAELDEARQAVNQFEKNMRRINIWGCAREQVILHGFEAAYRAQDDSSASAASASEMLPVSELEIGRAMRGEPVHLAAMIEAITESAPMQSFGLHTSVFEKTERHRPLLEKLLSYAGFVDSESPETMALGSNANVKILEAVRKKIPRTGVAVVLIDDEDSPLLAESPYRIIHSNEGVKALLFRSLNKK